MRRSEWILLGFFAYLALLEPFFQDRPLLHGQPVAILLAVSAVLFILAAVESTRFWQWTSMVRDWIPMVLTLVAFREMEFFLAPDYNLQLEIAWIRWDSVLLNQWGLKRIVESLGTLLPLYLELCYLLVYGLGTYCVIVLWAKAHRRGVDRFYVVLLTGTLLAYALFPYFPSQPPRLAFPQMDPPAFDNVFRNFNLYLLQKATIHSAVFPSAHVSSAFSAAWAMFFVLPERKRFGWGLLIYAVSVAVATVYGRYHYSADAITGFGISLIAAAVGFVLQARSRQTSARS